jgi:hypothetical protein
MRGKILEEKNPEERINRRKNCSVRDHAQEDAELC